MNVILHPSAIRRGVYNARQIVRSAPGEYPDDDIIDACELLFAAGDALDKQTAQLVIDAMEARERAETKPAHVNRERETMRLWGWALVAIGMLGFAVMVAS